MSGVLPYTIPLRREGAGNEAHKERLAAQISQFQYDPEIIDFLADEAVRAGVASIEPFTPQMLRTKGGSWGSAI